MTALNISTDIPTDIDTLEKLHIWTCAVLSYLYRDENVQEANNRMSRVIDSAPYEITTMSPVTWRLISRSTIELSSDWQLGEGGMWDYAQDIGTADIPTAFKG